MAMGSTGTVNITPEMMNNAIAAIEEYRTKTNSLHEELKGTVGTLLSSSFSGNAANGFKFFNDEKIDPTLGESLTKLLTSLHDIVEGILKAIPDSEGLDDQLGDGNKQ